MRYFSLNGFMFFLFVFLFNEGMSTSYSSIHRETQMENLSCYSPQFAHSRRASRLSAGFKLQESQGRSERGAEDVVVNIAQPSHKNAPLLGGATQKIISNVDSILKAL